MATREIGIIMNGVTGRMGRNQHLLRSILALRDEGGVVLANGDRLVPNPWLVGRNETKLRAVAHETGVERWTTDLDAVLADPAATVFFDAASTRERAGFLLRAVSAGKHVYCEKPVAESSADALRVAHAAEARGVRNGVVQDKLFLPGIRKLAKLVEAGFFGDVLSARIDFGYWVFEGDWRPSQRPSWNYRAKDGGGIILDMWPHWQYVVETLFGRIRSVCCHGARHIGSRWNELGERYEATADDAAYSIVEMDGGIVVQINSSWCTRVNRRDLVTVHVDGTHGSAVAGLTDVVVQHRVATPRAIWNPDHRQTHDFLGDWEPVLADEQYENAFKAQWMLFLRHVAGEAAFPWTLAVGARGVQFAECAQQSWRERRWIDMPEAGATG